MGNYDEIKKYIFWTIPLVASKSIEEQTADFASINTIITELHVAGDEIDLKTAIKKNNDGTFCLMIELTCPNGQP